MLGEPLYSYMREPTRTESERETNGAGSGQPRDMRDCELRAVRRNHVMCVTEGGALSTQNQHVGSAGASCVLVTAAP